MNCTICHVLTTDTDYVVHESDLWRVVINPNQQYIGRLYVTLKTHRATLGELTSEEWTEFTGLTGQLERTLSGLFQPTHFNWQCLLNDAIRDEESPHVHWHLIPRYAAPVYFHEQLFSDHAWPHKYTNDHPQYLDPTTLSALHRTLRDTFTRTRTN